jgi:hypothetical protein
MTLPHSRRRSAPVLVGLVALGAVPAAFAQPTRSTGAAGATKPAADETGGDETGDEPATKRAPPRRAPGRAATAPLGPPVLRVRPGRHRCGQWRARRRCQGRSCAKRIVAYYGNPLSKRMGILGELPPNEMLARLDKEVARWNAADPATPVQPALHLIVWWRRPRRAGDGKYRLRMTDSLIDLVHGWAQRPERPALPRRAGGEEHAPGGAAAARALPAAADVHLASTRSSR